MVTSNTAATASTVIDIMIIVSTNVSSFLACGHDNFPDSAMTGRSMQLNNAFSSSVTTTSPRSGLTGTHWL